MGYGLGESETILINESVEGKRLFTITRNFSTK